MALTKVSYSMINGAPINALDFGAVGDGVTDDTADIQAAINYAQQSGNTIYLPTGKYRTTAPLSISSSLSIVGDMPQSQTSYLPGIGQLGGTWLYFDHTGIGISIANTPNVADDVLIEKIGTYRNQPAPAPGWTPTANDWDLSCYGASDVTLRDVFMLNPTKGIAFTGSVIDTAGRLEVYNFKAQPFEKGIVIDTAYDVCRLDQIHIWPFWKDDTNVHAYTLANLDAIQSTRNDNPQMSNIFTIFARAGLRLSQNANGSTSKLHLVNADFDRGKYGVWVDSSVTVADGQFENITSQGETGVSGTMGIFLQGTNTSFYFGNYSSAYTAHNAVRVDGTGNRITFAAAKANYYDQSGVGFPAFEAATGNWLIFATEPEDYNGGAGGTFSTTGNIVADKWRPFGLTVTSSSGTITSYTASGKFKVVGDTVHVQIVVELTDNGTGAGQLRATLPFGIPINRFVGVGRELATTGNALTATIAPSASYAEITTYNNAYPGGTGSLVNCVFEYDVNV